MHLSGVRPSVCLFVPAGDIDRLLHGTCPAARCAAGICGQCHVVSILCAVSEHRLVYIAPPTGRPRAHHKITISLFPGVHYEHTDIEVFSAGDEKCCTAAASVLSATHSTLAIRRQRKPCRRFIDVSAARRGRQTTKHAVQIAWVRRQLMSASPRCTPACVQEATCRLASTTCTVSENWRILMQ